MTVAIEPIECAHCRRRFRPARPTHLHCSRACAQAARVARIATSIKRLNVVPAKHRGAWAVTIATAWLWERGYEVYRNASPSGAIDIVAIKERETLYIDVKMAGIGMSVSRRRLGAATVTRPALRDAQTQAGIRPLYVGPDGFCSFDAEDLRRLYSAAFQTRLTESG